MFSSYSIVGMLLRFLLEFGFPETVEITVLIDSYRLAVACTDLRHRNIFQIDSDATILSLHIDEADMMFRSHRMRNASDLHLHCASIHECYLRNMLLIARIHRIRNQLLHLLAAAHHRNPGVHDLYNHIAAMTASIKFCCHSIFYLLNHFRFHQQIPDQSRPWMKVRLQKGATWWTTHSKRITPYTESAVWCTGWGQGVVPYTECSIWCTGLAFLIMVVWERAIFRVGLDRIAELILEKGYF